MDEYFKQIRAALFTELRRQCDRLLTLNQDAMRRKAAEAATLARRWFVTTLATALALVAGAIGFAIILSNSILRPVRESDRRHQSGGRGASGHGRGHHSRDELGMLAARFNDMAERIRQLRQTDMGKVLVAQQTAEAAMDSLV